MGRRERDRLIAMIMRQYDELEPTHAWQATPIVSLEDFFIGNDDQLSIAPNLDPHPGLDTFDQVLCSVRARPEVHGLWLGIHESPEADEELDADIWPTVIKVFVLTSAVAEQVEAWTAALRHSGAMEAPCMGVGGGRPWSTLPAAPGGMRMVVVMWH
ncbi:MAG TPA: hypothetical protein VKG45_04890 [Actinomycetes bacterium]|nr:hypothetical protein [Actinomycetes bacterium]